MNPSLLYTNQATVNSLTMQDFNDASAQWSKYLPRAQAPDVGHPSIAEGRTLI